MTRSQAIANAADCALPAVVPGLLDAWSQSFTLRVGVLAGIAALAALVELRIRGRRANRWREYLFVAAGEILGAMLGVVVDACTASIGPSYYVLGKGLHDGPDLRIRAMLLGASAGFAAGLVGAGALLIAAGPAARLDRGGASRLFGACLSMFAWSLTGAFVMGLAAVLLHLPIPLLSTDEQLVIRDAHGFTAVWWTHFGAYAGFLVRGTLHVRLTRRWRQSMPATVP